MGPEAANYNREWKRSRRSYWLRIAALLAILAVAFMLRRALGFEHYFTGDNINATITTVRAWAARFGAWGPALFSLASSVALFLMTPAAVIIYLSVVIFGNVTGVFVSVLSLLGGTTLIYGAGQALGRPFVVALLGKRLLRIEEYFLNRELLYVIYYRLIFFLNPLMNWFLCVSNVRYRNLILGTLIGTFHNIILIVWFGEIIVELIQSGQSLNPMKSPHLLIPLAIGLTIFLTVRILDAILRHRRNSST